MGSTWQVAVLKQGNNFVEVRIYGLVADIEALYFEVRLKHIRSRELSETVLIFFSHLLNEQALPALLDLFDHTLDKAQNNCHPIVSGESFLLLGFRQVVAAREESVNFDIHIVVVFHILTETRLCGKFSIIGKVVIKLEATQLPDVPRVVLKVEADVEDR